MDNIVSTIIEALTSYVTGSASAIGEGMKNLLFTVGEANAITGLSPAGMVIFTIMGIGFAVGLMRVIFSLFNR